MTHWRITTLLLGILIGLFSYVSHANTSNWRFDAEYGIEDDSNVVIDDTDQNANADNLAQKLKLGVGYKHKSQDKVYDTSINYSYLNTNYQDLSQYDSQLQLLSGKIQRKFDKVKLGINGQWIDANLDGQSFLKVKQLTPNLSYFFNKTNYIYSSITFGRKTFAQDPDRNADQQALSANYYRLFNGLNHYITLSAKYKTEDADWELYSYEQNELKVKYNYRQNWFELPHKLSVSYRFQKRDYDELWHPQIDEFRADKRHQWQAKWRIEWTELFFSELALTRNIHNSNVSFADYTQNKIALNFGLNIR